VQYLPSGTVERIQSGEILTVGRDEDGAVQAYYQAAGKAVIPKKVWNQPAHNAESGGTTLLSAMMPGRRFPYPKSLYAVEDTVRFYLADTPEAIVLDFFSGSATTTHAVMRLNPQDGGCRRSIAVTNNEVSEEEAKRLTKRGVRDGDAA
jgi:adenine-specific DNA-methyltransferase